MDLQLLKIAGQVAGIGGLALGVFLLLFREVIRKKIFPTLTKRQGFTIILVFLVLVWSVAISGIAAWVWIEQNNLDAPVSSPLEAAVSIDAGTFDALELLHTLGGSGGLIVEHTLSVRLEGRRVDIRAPIKNVALKVVLEEIFAQLNVQAVYEHEGDTVRIRERRSP